MTGERAPYGSGPSGESAWVNALGTMSGTSMDGIDLAIVRTNGERVERGPAREYPYAPGQRRRLQDAIAAATGDGRDALRERFADVEADVTEWHAEAIERFLRETRETVDVVGLHGHTLAHRPQRNWTLQLGDGPALAKRLGRDVVHDFRSADMAAGGQGAPLVPIYHRALAADLSVDRPLCFLNIGGVANLTFVDGDDVVAFDCGPGNMLLDRWLQEEAGIPFDQGGRIASEGRVSRTFVAEVLAHPFFMERGAKSLDRLDFAPPASGSMELSDGARTLTRLTAEAVAAAVPLLPSEPHTWIVCGGGRLNALLLADLRSVLSGTVEVAEAYGLDGGAMEAEAFGFLAARCLRGLPSTFPTTTGCDEPTVGGVVSRGDQPRPSRFNSMPMTGT